MLCDIAADTGNPVSFEAARWTDADLYARMATDEAERERCPQCRLTPDAAHYVTAVIDTCPTCEARDHRRNELGKHDRPGGFVRWQILEDEADMMTGSAWVQFSGEGARARKLWEQGGGG